MAKLASILDTIGNTPVVKISKLAPPHVNMWVKIEAFNPMGSVKDRMARSMIEAAEKSGELKPGQTVVEATSGNTGIGLAMVCAQKGYPLVVTMSENHSLERRKILRFLGAKVVLTPAAMKGTGMLQKAIELAETHGWFHCRQFENEANAEVHMRTTVVEILRDFEGERLDYWVTGCGTGGTLKGVGRVLRERRPETKIVVCEPDNSQTLGSGIAQPRNPDGSPAGSHLNFRPHLVQGWTPDFIPKLTGDALAMGLADIIAPINSGEAMRLSRELASKEGIFVGISAGATLAGALDVAKKAPQGSTMLVMLPDTGERYLSTPLFESIPAEMGPEEVELSRSTPSSRFDPTPAPAPGPKSAPPPAPAVPVTPEAVKFVAEVTSDPSLRTVLFAFEWCEFCWAVRKFFRACKIEYRSVDLDSVAYQKDNWGGKIRAALTAKTGSVTIPQIFVGGQFIGGLTDTFDAWKEGRLQKMLDEAGISYDRSLSLDPVSMLPNWLHPRLLDGTAACKVPPPPPKT